MAVLRTRSDELEHAATSCRSRRDRIQAPISPTEDSLHITTLRFEIPDVEPIHGDPQQLLEEWQKKLALKINNQGEIVPLYP